jgi:hypothetical protein
VCRRTKPTMRTRAHQQRHHIGEVVPRPPPARSGGSQAAKGLTIGSLVALKQGGASCIESGPNGVGLASPAVDGGSSVAAAVSAAQVKR